MTIINGMEVTDQLVDFLKQMAPYSEGQESHVDSAIESLFELNDYLVGALTEVVTDDIVKMREISNYLINVKSLKDDLKELNGLLKECSIDRKKDAQ